MIEKRKNALKEEQNFRATQDKSLVRLGFEKIGNSDFFSKEDFIVALQKNGQIRLFVDYPSTSKDSKVVGIEDGDPGNILSDALSMIIALPNRRFKVVTRTLSGSGSSRYADREDLDRIQHFQSIPQVKQLIQARFEQDKVGEGAQVFRRSFPTPAGEQHIYALIREEEITRIVRPWVGETFVTPSTRIVGFSVAQDYFGDRESILSFENDLVRFNIGSSSGGPKNSKFLREPTDDDLRLKAISPQAEASGFVIGGVNESALIRNLKSINDIAIEELENRMKPREYSREGFLGEGEKLLDVLYSDNEFVVAQGLSHQILAHPLKYVMRIRELYRVKEFSFRGTPYKIEDMRTKGFQESPFQDSTASSVDSTLTNLKTGESITFSYLHPHMIERYGFYEGKGTTYRVEPSQIIKVFNLLQK